ncbi:MAG: CDP-diacylglycerol--serine O-phosphatidyltransferase [Syntrophobacteria bacterium]
MLLSKREKRRRNRGPRQVKRGIYLLPNLFTTANLFSGFFGIIATINQNFEIAAVAILVSCLFDILDGKVARFTGSNSRFGVEYDSLADLVSFGVGPALLVYLWALKPFGRLGWAAAFLFVACGALRLARFNIQVNTVSKRNFVGLPIPAAACMVATTVLLFYSMGDGYSSKHFLLLAMTYLLGFLMVSNIPYYSFKEVDRFQQMPFRALVLAILLFSVIAARPAVMLFSLMLVYVGSALAAHARKVYRKRTRGVEKEVLNQETARHKSESK